MTSVATGLGMLVASKGGEWLLNKGKKKVVSKFRNFSIDTAFQFLSGVPQGKDQDLLSESKDYRGRAHFNWDQTRATRGGIWVSSHFVDGEELNTMLKNQQQLAPNQGKITLADFKRMMDEVPTDGSKAKNKGLIRLIKKDGKLVLDNVGAKGLGSLFVGFRCNLDPEHNRQTRALFADALLEDMKAIFPSLSNGTEMLGASALLSKGMVTEQMNEVYSKLQGLLSTEKTMIPRQAGGDWVRESPTLGQKLLRTDVNEILDLYGQVFERGRMQAVFDALISDACELIGFKGEDGKTDVATFLDRYKNEITEALGKSYEEMLDTLSRNKIGADVGANLRTLADFLQGVCQKEIINGEIERIRSNDPDGKFFEDNTRANGALQVELKATVREVVEHLSEGDRPPETVETLMADFMKEILPYVLKKCETDEAYRADFTFDKLKQELTDYITDRAAIRRGDRSKDQNNFAIIKAAIEAQKSNTQRQISELDNELEGLASTGAQEGSAAVVEKQAQRYSLQGEIERFDEALQVVNAIKEGPNSQIAPDSRIGKWLAGLGETQRNELQGYLNEGFKATDEGVFFKWLDHHWAEQKFKVKLPIRQDFLAIETKAVDIFRENALRALVANTSKKGEAGLQNLIAKLGDTMMDEDFTKGVDKKLKEISELQRGIEGGDPSKTRKLTLVESLIVSFVNAAIDVKIENDMDLNGFAELAKNRANLIVAKLKDVCSTLMSEWGSATLAKFKRSLEAYANQGKMLSEEVKAQMDAFKRELGKEIGEKLLNSFASGLADIVKIEDKREFEAALDSRLADYSKVAEKACQEKANALVYGLLGFTFEEELPPHSKARFENAELVGKGFVEVDRNFSKKVDFNTSSVFSQDELRSAFTNVSKNVWMNVVVSNAPGRGNLFTEFVRTTANKIKEKIKGVIKDTVDEKVDNTAPEFVRDLVGFNEWNVVRKVNGLFKEHLVDGNLNAKWVEMAQGAYGNEMVNRMERYRAFEKSFISECDRQVCERLSSMKNGVLSNRLKGLDENAIKTLAKDVRLQISGEAVKEALRKALEMTASDKDGLAVEMLVKETMAKISDKAIVDALEKISSAKAEEIKPAIGKPEELAKKVESSLDAKLCEAFGGKTLNELSLANEPAAIQAAFTQQKGLCKKLAVWTSERVLVDLKVNPLLVYNYQVENEYDFLGVNSNTADKLAERASRKHAEAFGELFKELRKEAEEYANEFSFDSGAGYLSLRKLFGPDSGLKLDCGKLSSPADCIRVFSNRLAAMKGAVPQRVKALHDGVNLELETLKQKFEATLNAWAGTGASQHAKWKDDVVAALDKAAKAALDRAISETVSTFENEEKTASVALGDAKRSLQSAYEKVVGDVFTRCTEVRAALNNYGPNGDKRKALLEEIRKEISASDNKDLIRENGEAKSVSETWQNWFAEERLQRALDCVLADQNADIVTLAKRLPVARGGLGTTLARSLLQAVLARLEENDESLRKGFAAVKKAYFDALEAKEVPRVDFIHRNVPPGALNKAFKEVLDCYLPVGTVKPKELEKVVQDYKDQIAANYRDTFENLFAGFKKDYNAWFDSAIHNAELFFSGQNSSPVLLRMYQDHCYNVFNDLVLWAMSEVINGADINEMANELKSYFSYDLDKTIKMYGEFLTDTNLAMSQAMMAKLIGASSVTDPQVDLMLKDEPLKRRVNFTQRQVWKNILAGLEKSLGHKMRFYDHLLDNLAENAYKPIGPEMPKGSTVNPSDKWITPGASIWTAVADRKVRLMDAASPTEPVYVVNARTKESLADKINAVRSVSEKAYGDFFEKHGSFVGDAIRSLPAIPKLSEKQRDDLGKLSIEKLLELHKKVVQSQKLGRKDLAAVQDHYKALKNLWLPFEDRLNAALGLATPAISAAYKKLDEDHFKFVVSEAEINALHSDVTTEPEDFLEGLAFDADGKPDPKLVGLIQDVGKDILEAYAKSAK